MTAVLQESSDALTAWSPTSDAVDAATWRVPPVDLETLDAGVALQTRIDRKYVLTVDLFTRLVGDLGDAWFALEIDRRRLFGYSSVYFDTADFMTYRAHLQGRRHRYKVRIRRYVDSGDCLLEVKLKGRRGVTVKERLAHPTERRDQLGETGERFVGACVGRHGAPQPTGDLRPVVATSNRRATFASLAENARLTVDVDLACGQGSQRTRLKPGFVLVESKVALRASRVDLLLREYGVRPITVSKYCVGVASLGLDLPTNPWNRTLRTFFATPTTTPTTTATRSA